MRRSGWYRVASVAVTWGAAAGLDADFSGTNPVWRGLATCSAVFIGAILAATA